MTTVMQANKTSAKVPTTTARLRELDLAHHLPAQQNYRLMQQLGGSRIITHADGCFIHDADGNTILDGMAGLWCVNVGYGRAELADVAREQLLQLPFYNTFFRTATAPTVELATKIASITGGRLQHVFFSSSGSEANDTAFRLARHYWDLRGQPQRKIFISRWNAYHGSTVAGTSLGGMKLMHAQGDLPIPGIEHIMQPYKFGEGFTETEDAFVARAANALEERILKLGADKVAAFIGEPVQGAGGVIIPPRAYWERIGAICKKYGILLICDEVICGFGRLGKWFGFQHFGLDPDMITIAKGLSSGYLPISATVVSHEIIELLREKDSEFFHGFTYSGHPTCAAVALRNIEIIEREGLVKRCAEDIGPYFNAGLQKLRAHAIVGETRSLGLIGAIEIVRQAGTNLRFGDKEGTAGPVVRDRCIANGLMVRAVRDSIVICPPLIITRAEVDQLVAIFDKSLTEAAALLAR